MGMEKGHCLFTILLPALPYFNLFIFQIVSSLLPKNTLQLFVRTLEKKRLFPKLCVIERLLLCKTFSLRLGG